MTVQVKLPNGTVARHEEAHHINAVDGHLYVGRSAGDTVAVYAPGARESAERQAEKKA